ncbi:MAG: DNA polymerase III subunit delta [candidate division Zixibacteria bacterium]|nr:DNA polymerase III subunit delta [candidate division Zixibacteria bacterium]
MLSIDMAAQRKKVFYEDFIRSVKKDSPESVYLIGGSEEFLKFRAQKLLLDKFVDPSTRDFNYDCFTASEISADDLIAACNTLPFGAGRRVIRLTGANRISPSFRKMLSDFIPKLPDSTTLIIVMGEISSITKFHQAAADNGVLLDCRPPFPNRLPAMINGFFNEFGIKANSESVQTIINTVGEDLYSIYNEVHKISLMLPEGKSLTPKSIQEISGAGSGSVVEEYLDALGRKDTAKAVALANGRLHFFDSALSVVFRIASMFSTIYGCLALPKSESIDVYLKRRGLAFKLHSYNEYCSNFNKDEIEKVFSLIFYAEWEAKLNPTPSQQIMQILSYYICNPNLYNRSNPFPGLTKYN